MTTRSNGSSIHPMQWLLCLLPWSAQARPVQQSGHELAVAVPAVLLAVLFAGVAAYILYLNCNLRRQLCKIQALKEQLADQAVHDPLTGLFNRRYLDEALERELARTARSQSPLSLLMIDIDHFKHINDTFGHPVGDRVLRQLGTLLERLIRRCDTACRYGGEEFVVLMPESTADNLAQRAEQLRSAFSELYIEVEGQYISATLSIGIATCHPRQDLDAGTLIKMADQALYRAKQAGRNRVETFRPAGHEASLAAC